MFKFGGHIEVGSKYFNRQRQVTDIFTITLNKLVLSEKVPCDNAKDYRYTVGY